MASGYNKDSCGDHSDLYCNATTTKGQGAEQLCSSTTGFETAVKSWKAISADETEIAAALPEIGPLSVALNAGKLQFYRKGIYNPRFCDPESLDHAVLLVGFGTDKGSDYWVSCPFMRSI